MTYILAFLVLGCAVFVLAIAFLIVGGRAYRTPGMRASVELRVMRAGRLHWR